MVKLTEFANAPIHAPRDAFARLAVALTDRRPAAALALFDSSEAELAPADRLAVRRCIWAQAGSIRALRVSEPLSAQLGAEGALGPLGLSAVEATPAGVDTAVAVGFFPESDLPRLDADALVLVCAAAANAGRAADLIRAQLALAEVADRVDLRVGHVEAAQAVAHALGDRALTALVDVFLARLDADFGEAEDAVERAGEVLASVTPEEAPIATTLALMVRAAVLHRAPVPTPSGTSPAPDPTTHPLDASLTERLARLGWSAGYPGPAWGLGLPRV